MKSAGAPVRWVDPSSIHLTLSFLGNIAAGRVGEITGTMEESAKGMLPFSLELKEMGVFPNPQRTRVAWVGLGGEVDKLLQLQKQLESNLELIGFKAEERAFTPHLTLARVNERASPDERQRFGRLVMGTRFETSGFRANALSLMRSQLFRAGAVYSRLSEVKLKG